jgi:hypothetical protein
MKYLVFATISLVSAATGQNAWAFIPDKTDKPYIACHTANPNSPLTVKIYSRDYYDHTAVVTRASGNKQYFEHATRSRGSESTRAVGFDLYIDFAQPSSNSTRQDPAYESQVTYAGPQGVQTRHLSCHFPHHP